MFYVPQILRLAQKQGTSLSQDNLSLKLFIVQFIPLFQDEWCMCRAYLFLKSWTASPKWAKLASQNRSFLKCFGITDYGNDFEKKKPGIIAQGITWTGTISLVSFLYLFFFLYYLCRHYLFTERHKILQNFWRLSIILSCDRVVWSPCWE